MKNPQSVLIRYGLAICCMVLGSMPVFIAGTTSIVLLLFLLGMPTENLADGLDFALFINTLIYAIFLFAGVCSGSLRFYPATTDFV